MKIKKHKDCYRIKISQSEYGALLHLVALSQEYFYKKSIDDACKCAEMTYWLFIEKAFEE